MAMATYVAEDRETKIILVSDALLGTGLYEFSVLHEAGHLLEGVDTKDRSYKNQIRQELAADNYALANGAELSDGFKICKLALNMMAISNISIAEKIKMTVVNAARVINFITKL
jgi:hypothetical protein